MALEDYLDEPLPVDVGGRTIEVRAVRVRQIKAFMAAIAPVWAYIGATAAEETPADPMLFMVMHHPDDVIAFVAAGTGVDREFLADLRTDELTLLAEAVLTVNMGFFAQRLIPAAKRARETVAAQLRGTALSPTSPAAGSA